MCGDFFVFLIYNITIFFVALFVFSIYLGVSIQKRLKELFCENKKEIEPVVREILSLSKNKRRLATLDLKNKLCQQIIKKAIVNSSIIDSLIKMERCDTDTLMNSIYLSKKMTLPDDFVSLTVNRVTEVMFRCQRIIDYLKDKVNLNELFKGITGVYPAGKISVMSGNIALVFICEDNQDFCSLLLPGIYEMGCLLDDSEISRYFSSIGGCYIKKTIDGKMDKLVIVIRKYDEIMTRFIYYHEVQHAINNLFCPEEDNISLDDFRILDDLFLGLFLDKKSFLKIIDLEFNSLRNRAEGLAKNELLSHLRNERYYRNIFRTLARSGEFSGSYDYLSRTRLLIKKVFNFVGFSKRDKVFLKIDSILRRDYIKTLRSAIEACIMLEREGFSRGDLIGIFIDKPLYSWKKISKRIKDAGGLDLLKDLW